MSIPTGPTPGLPTPPSSSTGKGGGVELAVFIALILLGIVAVGLAFARM